MRPAASRRPWTGAPRASPTSTSPWPCTVRRRGSGWGWTRARCSAAQGPASATPSCSTRPVRSAGPRTRCSSSHADDQRIWREPLRPARVEPMTIELLAAQSSPLGELRDWLSGRGLEVVLIILGSILLARFVAWVGARTTARIDRRATGGDVLVRSEAAKHRHSLTQVLTWAAIVLIYSIAVFFVLDRLGVPVTGLVAPATVLGVGLGFGAQRIVGDVLAGFFIITERQYGFGDVVSINVVGAPDAATGTVEDVTLRVTRVRSSDGEVVTVPNGQIVKVVNLSRDWARAVVDVPVPT